MPILKLIDQIKDTIKGLDEDVRFYGEMIDRKKLTRIALEEQVEKLSKEIDKDYGNK